MKVTLKMMDIAGVVYSWKTIYTALLHDFMEICEVEQYATKRMGLGTYEENEFTNDFIWTEKSREEIMDTMREIGLVNWCACQSVQGNIDMNPFEKQELNKIKYAILYDLNKQYVDSKEILLRKLAEIYADFGYPEDMSVFIYYMPAKENKAFTKEEGEKMLVSNFNDYLKKLKKLIDVQ